MNTLMETLNDFIKVHLFDVTNDYYAIPVFIWFIASLCILVYYTKKDLEYRRVDNIVPLLIFLIPTAFCGYAIYGFTSNFLVGFLTLLLYFYLSQVYHEITYNRDKPEDKHIVAVGIPDTLLAPLCTVWFGWGVIFYLAFLNISFRVIEIPAIRNLIKSLYRGNNKQLAKSIPLLPCMLSSYLVFLVIYFTVRR